MYSGWKVGSVGCGHCIHNHIEVSLMNRWEPWGEQQCVLLKWTSLPLGYPEARIGDPGE